MLYLKKTLATGVFVVAGASALAQASCPPPTLKVLRNNQEVSTTGSPLVARVTLRVSPAPTCPKQVSYRFRDAQLSLMRGGQPVMPALIVSQPNVDLSAYLRVAHAGDRIIIFIPYQNLLEVAADGQQQPYQLPQPTPSPARQPEARADKATGIRLTWVLTPNNAPARLLTP